LRNSLVSAVIANPIFHRVKQSVRFARDTDRLLRHASALMPTHIPAMTVLLFCFGK